MTGIAIRAPWGVSNRQRTPRLPRLQALWLLFAASLCAFILNFFLAGDHPVLGYVLETASCVSCGLSWLLCRELFKGDDRSDSWPFLVVAILFIACVTLSVSSDLGLERSGVLALVDHITILVGSTVLLLPFFELLDGLGRLNQTEKRFRRWFLTGYAAILGAAIILAIPGFSKIEHAGQVVCCVVALIASRFALRYRLRLQKAKSNGFDSSQNSEELVNDLRSLIIEQRVYLNASLKVSDIAKMLRQPDYKITRCITRRLGFENFNQMINTYRIEEAKRLLRDPSRDHQSILLIAMDCGFGSIGVFNRAFKRCTNQTPRAFRKNRLQPSLVIDESRLEEPGKSRK